MTSTTLAARVGAVETPPHFPGAGRLWSNPAVTSSPPPGGALFLLEQRLAMLPEAGMPAHRHRRGTAPGPIDSVAANGRAVIVATTTTKGLP